MDTTTTNLPPRGPRPPQPILLAPGEDEPGWSFWEAADEALDDANGDYMQAVNGFIAAVKRSRSLTDEALRWAARGILRLRQTHRRHAFEDGAEQSAPAVNDTSKHSDAPRASVTPTGHHPKHVRFLKAVTDTWYEYPLPMNLGKLGNATRVELKQLVEFYGHQEAGMRKRRKFYESVGQKLPDGKKVGDILTPIQLARIAGSCGFKRGEL